MKQRTKKTLAKRVKITASGKILHGQVRTGHLKRKWSTNKRLRKKRMVEVTTKGYKRKLKRLLNK